MSDTGPRSNDPKRDPDPASGDGPAPELSPTEARQARPEGVSRYVLGIGLPLAVVVLGILVIAFMISS